MGFVDWGDSGERGAVASDKSRFISEFVVMWILVQSVLDEIVEHLVRNVLFLNTGVLAVLRCKILEGRFDQIALRV